MCVCVCGRCGGVVASLHLCKVGQKVDIFSFINHLSGSHRLTRQKQRAWPTVARGKGKGKRQDQTSVGRPVINYTNGIKLRQLSQLGHLSVSTG